MSIARESLKAAVLSGLESTKFTTFPKYTYLLRENFTADFDIIISTKAFMRQELLEGFDVNFWKYGILEKSPRL